jgi:hypothetical protein
VRESLITSETLASTLSASHATVEEAARAERLSGFSDLTQEVGAATGSVEPYREVVRAMEQTGPIVP